jgi:hypothetical protein
MKGRRHRHCQCPIWVDGVLGEKEIRESLKLRDWTKAQTRVRDWEAEDCRASQPERKRLKMRGENTLRTPRREIFRSQLLENTNY